MNWYGKKGKEACLFKKGLSENISMFERLDV
jgi:hypothetical protein